MNEAAFPFSLRSSQWSNPHPSVQQRETLRFIERMHVAL
jgi:hypothetical protein